MPHMFRFWLRPTVLLIYFPHAESLSWHMFNVLKFSNLKIARSKITTAGG